MQNKILYFASLLAVFAVFCIGVNPIHAGGVSLAMALTAGFTKQCGSKSGGIVTAWGIDVADLTSFTLNSGTGAYSAVTLVATKTFYKFEFNRGSAEMKIGGEFGDKGSTEFKNSLEFYLGKLTQTHRNRLQDLYDSSNCGMIWICKDGNGQKWVLGYSETLLKEYPMVMGKSDTSTGKTFADPNGTTVTLETTSNEMVREYTGADPT